MAGTAFGSTSTTVNFSKNIPFRSGSSGIQLSAVNNPQIIQAILNRQEFPPGDIQLLDATVTASTGQRAAPHHLRTRPGGNDVILSRGVATD